VKALGHHNAQQISSSMKQTELAEMNKQMQTMTKYLCAVSLFNSSMPQDLQKCAQITHYTIYTSNCNFYNCSINPQFTKFRTAKTVLTINDF